MKVSRIIAFVFLFCCFAIPSSAQARTTVVVHPGDSTFVPDLQGWADKTWGWIPTPNETVDVYLSTSGVCSNAGGCAVPRGFWNKPNPTIWLNEKYVDPAPGSQDRLRGIFYHELGHVFDYTHLDDTERDQIVQMLGFPAGLRWYGDDTGRPNELFAEGASACWYGPSFAGSAYGYRFNFQETAPLCRALAGSYSNNNSWFGQRLLKGKRKFIQVTSRGLRNGPLVQWGGNFVSAVYRGLWKDLFTCKATVSFGKQGKVIYDICGPRIKVRSTLPRPFKFGYWDIPAQPATASALGS